MLEIQVQNQYNHPADKVWALTGNFAGLKAWLPGVMACRVEGEGAKDVGGNAVRIVDLMDGSVTKESLESLDEKNRSYSYAIIEAKGFDSSSEYIAHFKVIPLDANRCEVQWGARFRLPDSIPVEKSERAKQRIQQMYQLFLTNLESVLTHS